MAGGDLLGLWALLPAGLVLRWEAWVNQARPWLGLQGRGHGPVHSHVQPENLGARGTEGGLARSTENTHRSFPQLHKRSLSGRGPSG